MQTKQNASSSGNDLKALVKQLRQIEGKYIMLVCIKDKSKFFCVFFPIHK